jgi:hypothetical protein
MRRRERRCLGGDLGNWVADGGQRLIAIVPVLGESRRTSSYRGSEYLKLYPYVDFARGREEEPWINLNAKVYVRFAAWVEGANPTRRAQLTPRCRPSSQIPRKTQYRARQSPPRFETEAGTQPRKFSRRWVVMAGRLRRSGMDESRAAS